MAVFNAQLSRVFTTRVQPPAHTGSPLVSWCVAFITTASRAVVAMSSELGGSRGLGAIVSQAGLASSGRNNSVVIERASDETAEIKLSTD